MKKNFFKFLLLGVFTLSLGAGFVGCKDYDGDIDVLNEKVAELSRKLEELGSLGTKVDEAYNKAVAAENKVDAAVAQAKAEAIAAAKAEIASALAAGGSISTAIETSINAKLASLGISSSFVASQKEMVVAQLKLQQKVLEVFGSSVPELDKLITDLVAGTVKVENVDWDKVSSWIAAIDPGLISFVADIFEIRLVASQSGLLENFLLGGATPSYKEVFSSFVLDFNVTEARFDTTFPRSTAGFSGVLTFKKGKITSAGVISSMIIMVNPNTAVLSKDNFKLIRGDGKDDVMNYITPVDAQPYKELISRAEVETGMWKVDFALKEDITVQDLEKFTTVYDANNDPERSTVARLLDYDAAWPEEYLYKKYMFALGYEYGIGTQKNLILSTYDIGIYPVAIPPVYNLNDNGLGGTVDEYWFTVDGESVADIHNRWATTEEGRPTTTIPELRWVDGPAPTATNWAASYLEDKSTNSADNRTDKEVLPVKLGVPFVVSMGGEANSEDWDWIKNRVLGYTVVLDTAHAIESIPSEWNAWDGYTYTGLNKVVNGIEDLEITVNSPSAVTDIIGFRVLAVNYDGTYVDPDGKAFYVIVTDPSAAAIEVDVVYTAPVAIAGLVGTTSDQLVLGSGVNVANVSGYNLTVPYANNTNLAPSVVLNTSLVLYDEDGNEVNPSGSWATVVSVGFKNLDPRLIKDDEPLEGTLTLYQEINGRDVPMTVVSVKINKALKGFPDGIAYKTEVLRDDVIWAYPIKRTDASDRGAFKVNSAFNYNNTPFAHPEAAGDYSDKLGFYFTDISATTLPYRPSFDYVDFASAPPADNNHRATIHINEIGISEREILSYNTYSAADLANRSAEIKNFPSELNYGWGYIKYNPTTPTFHSGKWSQNPILTQYRSFVQDFEAAWTSEDGGPTLIYNAATTAQNNLGVSSVIQIVPIVGNRFKLMNELTTPVNYTSPDGDRTYILRAINMWTGSAFEIQNEYFTPSLESLRWVKWETTPQSSAPATDIPAKITLDIEDEFGHVYRIPVEGNMTIKRQG